MRITNITVKTKQKCDNVESEKEASINIENGQVTIADVVKLLEYLSGDGGL